MCEYSWLKNNTTQLYFILKRAALLAFTANSAAQSSAQTHIHSAIVVIDTSNNAWHSQVHWLVGTPYLAVKASNELHWNFSSIPKDGSDIHRFSNRKWVSRAMLEICEYQ